MKKCNINCLLCSFSENTKEQSVLLFCLIIKVNSKGNVFLEMHLELFSL